MVEWLAPIALYWTVAALYLGGFALHIEGGGGGRQLLGVIATFVLYLVVWFALRAVLRGPAGAIFAVVLACLIATLALPVLARIGFGVLGVKIKTA